MMRMSCLLGLVVTITTACVALAEEPTTPRSGAAGILQRAPKAPCCASKKAPFSRSLANYHVPSVALLNMRGKTVQLGDLLDHDGPVLLQFAFTSCATICPVLSSTTAQLQKNLGDDAKRLRIITISIDPQHDTAAVLKKYALSLGAGKQWQFLTGDAEDIATVRKAFDAYTPNKSRHEALTFLRSRRNKPWVRITGLISAAALTEEVRKILKAEKTVVVAARGRAE